MTTPSPLELLHPAGRVGRVLLLGEHCAPWMQPPGATRATLEVDLAVIAPSPADLRQSGWLERAALDAERGLADDGFVYALLPRRSRRRARGYLQQAGLVLEPALVELPGNGPPRYLLPLRVEPWRHTLARQIEARPRARVALRATRALPFGSSILAHALPAVGTLARRPGADPLLAWVERLGGGTRPTADAVVATSWRGPQGPIVLHCFAPGEGEPWGVAKVAPESSTEAHLLDRLGVAARATGARIPGLLAVGRVADCPVLVETVVSGRPAAELLAESPGRFTEIVGALSCWQERWNRATAATGGISRSRLELELMGPAGELGVLIPDEAAYRRWLAKRSASLAEGGIPAVATHNDLTMWNVLPDERGSLGVLDWAQAEGEGLPLADFIYAVADAAAACDGYRNRTDALRSCFLPGGARAQAVAALQERLRASLQLSPAALELIFHACWLRHAVNEQRAGTAGERPFLDIVRWQARRAVEAA